MPNRILREGILSSLRVNQLSWEGEVFYRRLMSVVDDYGRFDAHPAILRASLFPLKLDQVREANVERLISECEKASLVRRYEVAGKQYLELSDFRQQVRANKSRFPDPPSLETHVISTCVADDERLRTKTYSETETYSEAYAKAKAQTKTHGDAVVIPPELDSPDFISAWETFLTHRSETKKPLKLTAQRQLLKRLKEWGKPKSIEALEQTVANGWQGVFEPKNGSVEKKPERKPGEKVVNWS